MVGRGRARCPFWPPGAGASQRYPDCVSSMGTDRAGGGRGRTKAPPVPTPKARRPGRLRARSLLGPCNCIFFGFLTRSLLFISFPSFIFIFKLPAGLDAVHSPRCLGARRADGRSRLRLSSTARPAAAAAGSQGGRSRGAGAGGRGVGGRGTRRGTGTEARNGGGGGQRRIGSVRGCAPAWLGQQKFSSTGSSSPVQSSRDLAVIMWLS